MSMFSKEYNDLLTMVNLFENIMSSSKIASLAFGITGKSFVVCTNIK